METEQSSSSPEVSSDELRERKAALSALLNNVIELSAEHRAAFTDETTQELTEIGKKLAGAMNLANERFASREATLDEINSSITAMERSQAYLQGLANKTSEPDTSDGPETPEEPPAPEPPEPPPSEPSPQESAEANAAEPPPPAEPTEEPEEEPPVGSDQFLKKPWGKIEGRTWAISKRTQEFISRHVMPLSELEIKKAAGGASIWERCLLGWNRGKVERGLNWMLGRAEKEKIRLGQLTERFNTAEAANKRLARAADELKKRGDLLTPKQQERLAHIQTQIQEMLPFLARLSGELEAQRSLVNEYGDSIVRSADYAGMETVKKAGEGYLIKDEDFIGNDPGERFSQRMEGLMEGVWSADSTPEPIRDSIARGKSIFERLFAWLVTLDERRTPLTKPPKPNGNNATVQQKAQPTPQPSAPAKQKK